jgi:hypothetical protein
MGEDGGHQFATDREGSFVEKGSSAPDGPFQLSVSFLDPLRDPYWPLRAAHVLKQQVAWPKQYERARG